MTNFAQTGTSSGGPLVVNSGNTLTLYNTTDQTTNFERFRAQWSSNIIQLFTENGGTGTLRDLRIGNSANGYINISATAPGTLGQSATIVCGGTTRFGFGVTLTTYAGIWVNGETTAATCRWYSNGTNITQNAGASGRFYFSFNGGTAPFEIDSNGAFSRYRNINTAGWAVPAIYAAGRSTGQTAAVGSVATYTVGGTDGTFEVSANVLVTTATTHSFTVTCSYTDEGNTARTATMNFVLIGGGAFTNTIANANGAVPYQGIPLHIRCKAATAITIATTGTFTTVTYNVEGVIRQLA